MTDPADSAHAAAANRWLSAFGRAIAAGDADSLEKLFRQDAHWRDLVAFTWRVATVSRGPDVVEALLRHGADKRPRSFAIDPARTPPGLVTRAGARVIEAFFRFETERARCVGVLRLDPPAGEADVVRAWTLFTAVDELKGFEEQAGSRRPRGEAYSRDFRGPNWLDRRRAAAAYADGDPAVLVVGGGQAGLSIAARLRHLDIDTLVIDREARIGDNWRHRYHALTLHNQVQVNHLPYMPFPPGFPTYLPKDKLASWFEAYAEAMEINFWTGTKFAGARFDEAAARWTAELRRDGTVRTLRPRHIVMATGASDLPNLPEIAGLADFKGRVVHSSEYADATPWAGRPALVIGTGTSGHDVAQDLHSNGAQVTLVQRSPTLVVDIEPSAQLPYALYNEGRPLEECDLIAASIPLALFEKSHRMMATQAREMDRDLHAALERAGFRLNKEDQTGWQFMYLTRGGGYYFNVGCSTLIAEGRIALAQFADIDRFVADGARMKTGEVLRADLVVLATGYRGQQALVRRLFGDAVAERVGPVWGIDREKQELRNMYAPTAQRGLWFIAGSFAQCRINSKYLALQIRAAEAGLVPTRADSR